MSSAAYPFATRLADQPADSSGRRWFLKELSDAAAGGADQRAELLARALVQTGGIVLRPTLGLVDETATLTGPILGITEDGLAPLLVDPTGDGVELDLATLGAAFADGTHAIVLRPTPVLVAQPFTTPEVSTRDPQGNIVATIPSEAVVYQLTERLGALALIEGVSIETTEVLVATVAKAGSAWSSLAPAGSPPRLRARVEDLADVSTLGRADGYLLAWDEGTEQHIYVPPGGSTPGSGSGS